MFKISVPAWLDPGEGPLWAADGCLLAVSSHAGRAPGVRALILFMKAPPS